MGGSLFDNHTFLANALTVDVEDYFHVTAFEAAVRREQWGSFPSRVEANTRRVLDLMEETGTKGTFFVLGWVAREFPHLVRAIHDHGHEIASHGFGHERIYLIGPEKFRDDVRRAKRLLEDLCGREVAGYRAPSFSITEKSLWAFDILVEEGFRYDSSVFPIRHDLYGMRAAPPFPHEVTREGGKIREFPLSTVEYGVGVRNLRIPVAGGGYLRLFPTWFLRSAIRRINRVHRQPAVLYFHPWEIDPGQPRIRAGITSRLRHYNNLSGTLGKVRSLLAGFRFAPMADVLGITRA